MPLEPEDVRHLEAAQGFADLGMHLEADAELDEIAPQFRHLPEVLRLRLEIYQKLERWELMEVVARRLVQTEPGEALLWVAWAEATRRARSIIHARPILVEALSVHPRDPAVLYGLACLESLLGELDAAREHLATGFGIDDTWRIQALDDPDLAPLWNSMQTKFLE
jgi:predicted Zn-dependent protease